VTRLVYREKDFIVAIDRLEGHRERKKGVTEREGMETIVG
jgi:hypothetical protein